MDEDYVKEEVDFDYYSLDGRHSANISQFNRKVFCRQYHTIGRHFYGYNRWSRCGDRCVQDTYGKKRIEDQKRQDHYDLLKTRIKRH